MAHRFVTNLALILLVGEFSIWGKTCFTKWR